MSIKPKVNPEHRSRSEPKQARVTYPEEWEKAGGESQHHWKKVNSLYLHGHNERVKGLAGRSQRWSCLCASEYLTELRQGREHQFLSLRRRA